MNFKSSESSLLWISHGMPPLGDIPHRVDLVLAPPLYLMKREELPIRFAFEARKIAPSLLEELGAGEDWTYEVLPEEKGWLFFAYNPEEIRQVLREAGIPPEKTGKLYFAQQFREALTTPGLLDNGEALVTLDRTVTLIPGTLAESAGEKQTLATLPSPAKAFTLQGLRKHPLINRTVAVLLPLALLLLAGAWLIEGVRYHRAAAALQQPLEKAIEENPTLASGLTRHNIHERYATLDKTQRQIRETLRKIGSLISRESKLASLEIDPRGYEAIIEAPGTKLSALKKLAADSGLPAEIHNGKLKLKGGW